VIVHWTGSDPFARTACRVPGRRAIGPKSNVIRDEPGVSGAALLRHRHEGHAYAEVRRAVRGTLRRSREGRPRGPASVKVGTLKVVQASLLSERVPRLETAVRDQPAANAVFINDQFCDDPRGPFSFRRAALRPAETALSPSAQGCDTLRARAGRRGDTTRDSDGIYLNAPAAEAQSPDGETRVVTIDEYNFAMVPPKARKGATKVRPPAKQN
jgi:hypothetical protein